ncbi:Gfo/Idh/MocA family protein [Campylobacter cuniculorum]|nr:Gfo/Idh/MocA family oxidoreductase [Campylobacter cuniculorum]QOR05024.1 Gfo/Idh/MocA family oxidoreductase [Campylobacter cuniculorum]
MKIGIIGLGKMGQNHLKELSKNPKFTINALFDLNQNLNSHAPFFQNLDEFLAQNNDCVIIATPTNTHLELAKKLFGQVKTLLIEKPLAINLKEIEEIQKLAISYQNNIAIGFCERFNPAVLTLKQELKNEKIISINIQRYSPYPTRILDIGVLQDLAVHDLDLLYFLSKQRITKAEILKKSTQNKHRESESILACECENFIACVHQSWNSSQKLRKIHLITQNHFFEADLNEFSLKKDGKELQMISLNSPLFSEHNALFDLALSQQNDLACIEDAYAVQELLERCE